MEVSSMTRPREEERLVKTTVWLTLTQKRALKVAAALTDRGPSEVLREALDQYLTKHQKPPEPPKRPREG
jgi:hypothetical protein